MADFPFASGSNMARLGTVTDPVFKIVMVCSSSVFCINFEFVKYCIKISFILMAEFLGTSSQLAQKQMPHSPHSSPALITNPQVSPHR